MDWLSLAKGSFYVAVVISFLALIVLPSWLVHNYDNGAFYLFYILPLGAAAYAIGDI